MLFAVIEAGEVSGEEVDGQYVVVVAVSVVERFICGNHGRMVDRNACRLRRAKHTIQREKAKIRSGYAPRRYVGIGQGIA